MAAKYTERELSPKDSKRIKCQWGLGECDNPAVVCETVTGTWPQSMSFYYYCTEHRMEHGNV
jgi:hypothetical protein